MLSLPESFFHFKLVSKWHFPHRSVYTTISKVGPCRRTRFRDSVLVLLINCRSRPQREKVTVPPDSVPSSINKRHPSSLSPKLRLPRYYFTKATTFLPVENLNPTRPHFPFQFPSCFPLSKVLRWETHLLLWTLGFPCGFCLVDLCSPG